MPRFLPKLEIVGTPRKRGTYYRFNLAVGWYELIKNLRYYVDTREVFMPKRVGFAKKAIADHQFVDEFHTALKRVADARFGN